jgi:gamma-glutamylcyclotransferase (GGCT)/AIG2-like uncharacterized protein YtfP
MTKFFEFINKNLNFILFGVIAFLLLLYGSERKGRKDLNDNLIVMKDSVQYQKNKSGELYAQVKSYAITQEQLKSINGELYNEVEKLKKQKPILVVKDKIKIEYKDTTLTSTIAEFLDKDGNKTFNVVWKSDTVFTADNSILLSGVTSLKIDSTLKVLNNKSALNDLDIRAALYLSYTEEIDGVLRLNARTDFPNMKFTSMEGYIIDPSKTKLFNSLKSRRRFGLSAFGGLGTYFDGTSIRIIPTVGFGFTYDLLSF